MNNILCCNAGRRGRLMIDMRKTIGDSGNVVATDISDRDIWSR